MNHETQEPGPGIGPIDRLMTEEDSASIPTGGWPTGKIAWNPDEESSRGGRVFFLPRPAEVQEDEDAEVIVVDLLRHYDSYSPTQTLGATGYCDPVDALDRAVSALHDNYSSHNRAIYRHGYRDGLQEVNIFNYPKPNDHFLFKGSKGMMKMLITFAECLEGLSTPISWEVLSNSVVQALSIEESTRALACKDNPREIIAKYRLKQKLGCSYGEMLSKIRFEE